MKKYILFALLAVLLLFSCATNKVNYTTSVMVVGDNTPQREFASSEIDKALLSRDIKRVESNGEWVIRIQDNSDKLPKQSYCIEVLGKVIEITAGDERGAMYGLLEVAEEIKLYRIENVKSSYGEPDILTRGIKFNIPLDMRTPSYSDSGTVAQYNIPYMWDMDFWTEYIDELARNRFNAISIWSLNPFPSMVKVPEYPEVALDDVWRVKDYPEKAKGNATDMTKPEFYNNYEVVKEMTIDEKIEFWNRVMEYGESRGIDFYLYTWNVYTFGENGKYGITNDLDNEVTKDYYRASVRELVKTYPLLKGIGITAGENMGTSIGATNTEEWLYDTYGRGINDALAEDPDRDFMLLHRLHYAEFDNLLSVWKDLKCPMNFSDKYSIAHMYSATDPTFTDDSFDALPEDSRLFLEIRNDDNFNLKFGDDEFYRAYFSSIPGSEKCAGFFLGSDGYITGRVCSDCDREGELFIKKHWITYKMIGRLSYDLATPSELFSDTLSSYYGTNGEALLKLMRDAGKTYPLVNQLIWFDGDSHYIEADSNDPQTYSYYGFKYLVKNDNTQPGSGFLSIAKSVNAKIDNESTEGYVTAYDVVESLREYGNKALKEVEELRGIKVPKDSKDDYLHLLKDEETLAYLGLYYADKIEGALYLREYNNTLNEECKKIALKDAESALNNWKQYASLFSSMYKDELLSRVGWIRVNDITPSVESDISVVSSWKPRKLK